MTFFVLCFQETFRNCADIQIFSNAPTGFVPNGIDSPYVPYAPPSAIYVLKRTRNGQALRIPFIVRHQVMNFSSTIRNIRDKIAGISLGLIKFN